MGLMDGKTVLVFGVANKNSIAWGISRKLHAEGAEIALSYATPKLESRVRGLGEQIGSTFIEPCDVSSDEEIERLFAAYEERYEKLDGLVHSIGYAPREDMGGPFRDVSREGFRIALDISAYSLIPLTRHSMPLMRDGGSVIALSYYAAEKVVPAYNVMAVAKAALECEVRYLAAELGTRGIRVNAISAGPIRTLAATGIDNFKSLHGVAREIAPLRRDITTEDVGNTALWLMSDLGAATTGDTIYADGGYHSLGVTIPDSLKPDWLTFPE
ncbi:MAG: enoyl-ACP reductase [Anaerolineae bacterium]|jgi:enoyl-[acyl-carrier protein] reductase I